MIDRFSDARHDVWEHARKMWQAGLVVASAGNVSRRVEGDLIAITPTSIPYDVMTAEQVVIFDMLTGRTVDSTHAPSYELPMHVGVYKGRPDLGAIVHTHSPYVTTLSVLHRKLPPIIDEMVLYFGGTIEVTDYAFTGTEAVGRNVLKALGDRTGVILANHGNVCVGRDLNQALHVAMTMESTARVYVQSLQVGEPQRLPPEAITAGRRMFDTRKNS